MKVESVAIDKLHQDPSNVRVHPERNMAAIRASLARFGQQRPILIDGKGVVRAGNGTLAAARELGWDKIQCVRTPLEGSEANAYAIADNRTAEIAEWDDAALAATLRSLQSEDFDLAALGYDDAEVDALCDGLAEEMAGSIEAGPDEFGAALADDGYIAFKFGDYAGRVGRDVYDSFVTMYKAKQADGGEPMLDDVLRTWLGV